MGGGLIRKNRGRTVIYDFRRPDKFSREQIMTMKIMHDTFCRLALSDLAQHLGISTHVEVHAVDQICWEEFIRSIPDPTAIGVVDMDPLKCAAAFEISPELGRLMIQRLAGMPGNLQEADAGKRISRLEYELLDGLYVRLLGHLREAWTPILDLKPKLRTIVDVPSYCQIAPPSEMVILVSLKVQMGSVTSMMNLVYPFLTVEPILNRFSASWMYRTMRSPVPPLDPSRGYRAQDRRIPMEAVLAGPSMKLGELLDLETGSLIPLESWDQGEVWIQGAAKDPGEPVWLLGKVRSGSLANNESAGINLPRTYLRLFDPQRLRSGRLAFKVGVKGQAETKRMLKAGQKPGPESDGELESLETPGPQDVSRDLAALGGRFEQALTGLGTRMDDLANRQERLADQLLYGAGSPQMMPEAPAGRVLAEEPADFSRPRFDWIHAGNAHQVAQILAQEPACLAALVLGALEETVAARLLEGLGAEHQAASIAALARQELVRPEVVQVIDRVLGSLLAKEGLAADESRGKGMEKVVGILNLVNRTTERQVIEILDVRDASLSEEVKRNMFVFEDLTLLDDRALRKLLDRVDLPDLAKALKNIAGEVMDRIMGSLSRDESHKVKELLAGFGPMYMKDIDEARQKIIGLLRQLESEGGVVIAHSGSDEVVV